VRSRKPVFSLNLTPAEGCKTGIESSQRGSKCHREVPIREIAVVAAPLPFLRPEFESKPERALHWLRRNATLTNRSE